ncbi:MAG: NAD(P)-dependent oxidoreductase [Segetibacter sp.]|nr:NAD(P)-dependent oxidoreductase [Segetibacter sp.]
MNNKIGIIGFGTVGIVLSNIFNNSGTEFMVYDVLIEDPLHKDAILNKAININAPVVDLPSLIAQSTYVISTVTTQVAETVANKCLPYLRDSQYYIDCNSTSPGIKINIQNIIEASKADFIEGVILNAVNPGDATIEMLIGGGKGKEVVNFLQASNIKAKFYTEEVGKASMFKMLRSIFSKGVEVLLIEMLVSAKKAGIADDLWREITTFMDSKSFEQIGETWIKSHAVAYDRRFYEMKQVIETMNEIGVSPILTEATLQYFQQSRDLDLKSFFSKAPSSADEVITVIADHTSRN